MQCDNVTQLTSTCYFCVGEPVALVGLQPVRGLSQVVPPDRGSSAGGGGELCQPHPAAALLPVVADPVLQQGQEVGGHEQPKEGDAGED